MASIPTISLHLLWLRSSLLLTSLYRTDWPETQRSTCPLLLNAGIKGVHHQARPPPYFWESVSLSLIWLIWFVWLGNPQRYSWISLPAQRSKVLLPCPAFVWVLAIQTEQLLFWLSHLPTRHSYFDSAIALSSIYTHKLSPDLVLCLSQLPALKSSKAAGPDLNNTNKRSLPPHPNPFPVSSLLLQTHCKTWFN